MTENYYIGQIFEEIYPPEVVSWCYENNAKILEIEPEKREVEEKYTEIDPETGEEVEKTRIVEVVVRRFEIVEIPEHIPTQEEQRKNRENAYQNEVDPITCHINRLKDEEQTPEIEAEIEALKEERAEKVEDIKARFPYPVE